MKTAKKLLALVLVIVMAIGLTSLAAAKTADEYTDIASITDPDSLEALYVMTAIGITQGYPEGNFAPNGIFTRAEATKIVAWMLLGSAADSLPKTATQFSDVPAGFWASGYISYCTAQGILVGYGDGKFGPNDTVTAAQFTIMLLRALGYGLKGEYTGDAWAMNAYLDATKDDCDIFTLDVDFMANATREQVIVYAFNALNVHKEETTEVVESFILIPAPSYNVLDASYTSAKQAALATLIAKEIAYESRSAARAAAANAVPEAIYNVHYTTESTSTTKVIAVDSLAYTVFGLTKETSSDDLGRPGIVDWIYKKASVYTVSGDEPVATFDKSFTQADLYKITGKGPSAAANVDTTWNDKDGQNAKATPTSLSSYRLGTVTPASTDLGNGVRTEIYKVGTNYQAVVIEPSFAKLTIKATAATGTKGAYNTYSVGGADGVIFTSHVDAAFEPDDVVINGDVKNGDMVLYYQGDSLLYIEAVDIVTGVLTAISSGRVYTIDGNKLNEAAAIVGKAGISPDKEEQSFYLDSFKNVLGLKEGAAPPLAVVMLLSIRATRVLEDNEIIDKYFATVVDLDGTVQTVETDGGAAASGSPADQLYNLMTGSVVAYEIVDGQYTFKTTIAANNTALAALKVLTASVDEITKGSVSMALLSGTVGNANNSTKFVVVNYADSLATAPNGKVTVYTGIANVPNFTSLTQTTAVSYPAPGASSANTIANIVYIFDNTAATTAQSYAFYTGAYSMVAGGYNVDLIIDGDLVPTFVTTSSFSALTANTLYSSLIIGANGSINVVVGTNPKESEMEGDGGGSVANAGGLLSYTDKNDNYFAIGSVADSVPVYTFKIVAPGVPAIFSEGTAADLDEDLGTNGELHYVATPAGVVVAIYIILK